MKETINTFIHTASEKELRDLHTQLVDELSLRHKRKAKANKRAVQLGKVYKVEGLKGPHNGCLFTVLEIRRTRGSGTFAGEKISYTVPISCLVIEAQ
jgi:hypothetical protein